MFTTLRHPSRILFIAFTLGVLLLSASRASLTPANAAETSTTSPARIVLSDGLIGHWPLSADETGFTFPDHSGFKRDAQASAPPQPSKFGPLRYGDTVGSHYFANGAHLSVSNADGHFDRDAMTFAAWIYYDGADSADDGPIAGMRLPNDIRFTLYRLSGGALAIESGQNGFSGRVVADVVPLRKWVHLTVRFGTVDTSVFVNGNEVITFNDFTLDRTRTLNELHIGRNFSATFSGKLADVRVYDHETSDQRIQALGSNSWSVHDFSQTADYFERVEHAMVAGDNGDLYIFGGRNTNGAGQSSTIHISLKDGGTPTFKTAMSQRLIRHHALRLNDGRILVVGGAALNNPDPARIHLYNPVNDSWQLGDDYDVSYGTATLLNDGTVLLAGGNNAGNEAYIFDPANNSLVATGFLNKARQYHTATALPDGTVLVVGGQSPSSTSNYITTAELWNPATGQWTELTDLPQTRVRHTADLVEVNEAPEVVLIGGYNNTPGLRPFIQRYDPVSQTFSTVNLSAAVDRSNHDSMVLPDNSLLIIGGQDNNGWTALTSVVRYIPDDNVIEGGGFNLNFARSGNMATTLSDGSVVAYGNALTSDGEEKADVLFDPAVGWMYAYASNTQATLDAGQNFRTNALHDCADAPVDCTARPDGMALTDDFSEYADGEFYWQFCADYGDPAFAPTNGHSTVTLHTHRRCPEWDSLSPAQKADRFTGTFSPNYPANVQNALADARDAAVVQWLFPATFNAGAGQANAIAGVNTAVSELATAHAMFGNEFLLNANRRPEGFDALRSTTLIDREMQLLQRASHQFMLSAESITELAHIRPGGADDARLIDWLSIDTLGALAFASSQQVSALEQLARLEQLVGTKSEADLLADIDAAIALQNSRILLLADLLADVAADDPATADIDESRQPFVDAGGDQMINNIGRLDQLRLSIISDLNPLGYESEFVPLLSSEALLAHVCGDNCLDDSGGVLGGAISAETAYVEATRIYDSNQAELGDALASIAAESASELLMLCGGENDHGNDGWAHCNGGLMEQNRLDFIAANENAALAWQRSENIADLITIEEGLAQVTITTTLNTAKTVAANELAIGKLKAYRTTSTDFVGSSVNSSLGVEASVTASAKASVKASANPAQNDASVEASVELAVTASAGVAWETTTGGSTETTWDINAAKIGRFNSMSELRNAEKTATIVGAKSAAEVQRLLLEQSNLLLEYEIAVVDINKVVAEHNHLVQQYQFHIDQRADSETSVENSYANRPYWRLLKDVEAQQYEEALRIATHYAYLAAKSVEYLKVAPIAYIDDLYQARTAGELQAFMVELQGEHLQLAQNSTFGRSRYKISFARQILGLSDQVIQNSTADLLDAAGIEAERAARFQSYLQEHTYADELGNPSIIVDFSTQLDVPLSINYFDTTLAGQRISGTNNDTFGCTALNPCYGLWLNMVTDQTAAEFNNGLPRIKLSHGGHSDYMNNAGEFVSYRPGPATINDFDPSTIGFTPGGERLATVTAHINMDPSPNANPTTPTGNLKDFSVATSQWRLEIEKAATFNQPLDVSQLNDIEIRMDAVGYPTSNRAVREAEALRLAAVQANEPIPEGVLATVEAWQAAQWAAAVRSAAPTEDPVSSISAETYTGRMMTLDPIALGTTEAGFELFFNSDNTITGTLCAACSAGYGNAVAIAGSWHSNNITPTFTIETTTFDDGFSTRTLSLTGDLITRRLNADKTAFDYLPYTGDPTDGVPFLKGSFSEQVAGILSIVIVRQGDFILSPPTPDYVLASAVPTAVGTLAGNTTASVSYVALLVLAAATFSGMTARLVKRR